MNHLYEKIYENFKINWDINSLTDSIVLDIRNPDKQWEPYSDKSGMPHWQIFDAGIAFSRNFYRNFQPFCAEVANSLNKMQNELENDNQGSNFIKLFLNHIIDEKRVNLIRVPTGNSVKPHVDLTRDTCINIGLINSNTCNTHIVDSSDIFGFWENSTRRTYCMQDGDVYMVSVKHAHAVESLVEKDSNLTRYIITYNMMLR
jgi:hypothetical protein